jgi:hypothetical protein
MKAGFGARFAPVRFLDLRLELRFPALRRAPRAELRDLRALPLRLDEPRLADFLFLVAIDDLS